MADAPIAPGLDWPLEQARALLRLLTETDSSEVVNAAVSNFVSMNHGTYWLNREGKSNDFLENLKTAYVGIANTVAGGVAGLAAGVYGVPLDAGEVGSVATGGAGPGTQFSAGMKIVDLIFKIFNIDEVKEGYLHRIAGGAEKDNFARFVGLNWQLQIADILAGFVSGHIPWDIAKGVPEVGEGLQKMLGLEDAQEEILEPLMEKLIVSGLEKYFNRQTKPTDLSPEDAVSARIRDYIGEQTFNAIMDNEGVMDEIRPTLIKLQAKNLTEADFRDLYQRGEWNRDDVYIGFRTNGYVAEDAQHKTALVTGDRFWTLRKELLNVKESQFAHGVLDEASLRAYVQTLHFDVAEEDTEIEIAKGKKSLSAVAKPKAIAGTFNVAPWRVKPGASAVMSWNIRNAEDITISGIGSVEHRGERVIQPDISQTYVLTASSDTDTERFEAVVQVGDTKELKRPTVSFSASPGRIQIGTPVELKWSTTNADTVSIDQVGPVAEAGAMPVFPFLSTIYTLRARNVQGERIAQDIVFVELPDLGLGKEQRPGISFAITPGVVSPKQNQTELTWTLTRAEKGTLTFPDGSDRDVGRNGALVFEATDTGIFTLKASNLFGETKNQQAIIMKRVDDDQPPPPPDTVIPVLTLSVSPATALPAENLFVFWSITGTDVGTLIFADGSTRQVGASGNQNVAAPSVPGRYEFRLEAANTAGPASTSVIIVVSTTT